MILRKNMEIPTPIVLGRPCVERNRMFVLNNKKNLGKKLKDLSRETDISMKDNGAQRVIKFNTATYEYANKHIENWLEEQGIIIDKEVASTEKQGENVQSQLYCTYFQEQGETQGITITFFHTSSTCHIQEFSDARRSGKKIVKAEVLKYFTNTYIRVFVQTIEESDWYSEYSETVRQTLEDKMEECTKQYTTRSRSNLNSEFRATRQVMEKENDTENGTGDEDKDTEGGNTNEEDNEGTADNKNKEELMKVEDESVEKQDILKRMSLNLSKKKWNMSNWKM